MSLINQMLKDLEKRPRNQATSESLLTGLRAHISLEFKKNRTQYSIIIVLAAILLLIFSILLSIGHTNHPSATEATQTHSITITQSDKNNSTVTTDQYTSGALLTGIALQMQQDISNLRFLLNQGALYQLSSDVSRNELIIILENTRLVAALPNMNYSGSGIESIQAFKDENGNLKLVLHLNPAAEIKRLELNEAGKAPELQLDIYYKNLSDVTNSQSINKPTIPVTIKKPVVESSEEQLYQHAIQLTASGQNAEAISLLKQLVNNYPNNFKTREYLANLLIQQNNKLAAANLLDVGIKLSPEHIIFIEMKAQLLVGQGRVNEALLLLQKNSPSIENEPNYYALMAALYQRQGRANLAANLYKKLLTIQSSNAKWWVGLGIALDALGDHPQAFEAYTNADSIGNLNPELKNFLSAQLHTT